MARARAPVDVFKLFQSLEGILNQTGTQNSSPSSARRSPRHSPSSSPQKQQLFSSPYLTKVENSPPRPAYPQRRAQLDQQSRADAIWRTQIFFLKWVKMLAARLAQENPRQAAPFKFHEETDSGMDLEETSPPFQTIPRANMSSSDLDLPDHPSYDIACTPDPSENTELGDRQHHEANVTDFSVPTAKRSGTTSYRP
jgi:hypothetical protein